MACTNVVRRLRWCVDVFLSCSFFAFRFEGTELLLFTKHPGEQSRSERNAPSLLAALGGWRSEQQCSATTYFVARNCRAATRGAASGRSEHDLNQRRTDEQLSHEHDGTFRGGIVPDGYRLNFLAYLPILVSP